MRIVIDMQGAQTESRFRGIGRYTTNFAQAVVRNRGEHEIILALNGLFPETIEPLRAAFEGILPQENIRVWHAPDPVADEHPGNEMRREAAELIREAFLASLQPDLIHVSSVFEGYGDDAVTSIGKFDKQTPVSVVLYDLIPLLNPDHYLHTNPRFEQYYRRKLDYLSQATLFLAISEFSRQEGLRHLCLSDLQAVNISTAIESQFHPVPVSEEVASQLRQKFGIAKPFILYTGGADERKNLPRLIQAWAGLPLELRQNYQMLFAGKMPMDKIAHFRELAKNSGMKSDELVFAGFVSDQELVQLYNLCKLFVFPSWHEDFGVPALEAMACGAPVIGANSSSLPEVIGLDEALFDPLDISSITIKIQQGLSDSAFRKRLSDNGLQRAKLFSWDATALRALAAWDKIQADKQSPFENTLRSKPRLAFISPLPPERTGIADYSAELLPALAVHYEIEVVVAQERVDNPWVNCHFKVRDVAWFKSNAAEFDRVLYQIGNSPFHQHMLRLLQEIPGTVVLHDFYLSGLMAWLEMNGGVQFIWTKALYNAHGYEAVRERYRDVETAKREYPVNFDVLRHAKGIIVHSDYSRQLARRWYGDEVADDWQVIPLLRTTATSFDKTMARQQLGLAQNDFVVCSFGFLGSTKLNHRLLECWFASTLAQDKECNLVFVGEHHGGHYGTDIQRRINVNEFGKRVRITGFVPPEVFRQYLMAADIAVQLRAESRGETSAAVLDCMNYALPVIVNANGSMAELDTKAVWGLPEEFDDATLVNALETLRHNPEQRRQLGERARQIILEYHNPTKCAMEYAEAIERFYHSGETSAAALVNIIAAEVRDSFNDPELFNLAQAIDRTLPLIRPAKQLFLDVTATMRNDLKTGIERVVRALMLALMESPPLGFRVEPIYLDQVNGKWIHRYACRYTLGMLGCPVNALEDEIAEPECGDILLGLDLSGSMLVQAQKAGLFERYRNEGVTVIYMVHDLLPVRIPEVFNYNSNETHEQWLKSISTFDGAICISKTVADDFMSWRIESGLITENRRPYFIDWSHHGADMINSAPSRGLPSNVEFILKQFRTRPTFLMVGTIEPRKAYLQTIEAFTQLWGDGLDANLVIVGKEGWQDLPEDMRRNIPETVELLRNHPELNKRLFWLEGISDEYLEKVYATSTCLIAASYGEGFGLPLIEAAQHKVPIIARDIPVFREVAGEHAYYFSGNKPKDLVVTIQAWLMLFNKNQHPLSVKMPWLTWKESAAKLTNKLLKR